MAGRIGKVHRMTGETEVKVQFELLGRGSFEGDTGIPFMNHMLELFTRHGMFNLSVYALRYITRLINLTYQKHSHTSRVVI